MRRLLWIGLALFALASFGQTEELGCNKGHAFPGDADAGNARQYAPDRNVDIVRLILTITPDFDAKRIEGTSELIFTPIAEPLEELRVDAVDLEIGTVTSGSVNTQNVTVATDIREDHVLLTFSPALEVGTKHSVQIPYSGEPNRGLYFRTPDMGFPETDTHLWTQGEPHDARYWFPVHDYPNEKFASEVHCTVPKGMVALSNGVLRGKDEAGDSVTWHWVQDQPHVSYLMALVAGKMEALESQHGELPIALYVPASKIGVAKNTFADTAAILAFLEAETKLPFPWDKYYQAAVSDYPLGGMENTTLTILNDGTLYPDETENVRTSEGLVAHEAAHQWFGDYVTCKDWSHIWLNEGFATYYTHLFAGEKHGELDMLYGLWGDGKRIVRASKRGTPKPIVTRNYSSPWEQFGHRAYQKGSWVLHMLRSQLGPDLYRKVVAAYLRRNAFGVVETEDLVDVVEELSGKSFDRFFDQWVYHAGQPSLDIRYAWNQKDSTAHITIRQTQKVDDNVLVFSFPATFRFVLPDGPVDHTVTIDRDVQDFYVKLDAKPSVVRFDPELTVLADVNFRKAPPMLFAQLANDGDPMGQILAIEALESRSDSNTIAKLKAALNGAAFWGVRAEAGEALGGMREDAAFDALTTSMEQDDARVRRIVARSIGNYFRSDLVGVFAMAMKNEQNPAIQATMIRALAPYAEPMARDLIADALRTESHDSMLTRAAVEAGVASEDPFWVSEILKVLTGSEPLLTLRARGEAIRALGSLGRHLDDTTDVFNYLAGQVDHPSLRIRRNAVRALGLLGDPRALTVLERFTADGVNERLKESAEAAVKDLQAKSKVPAEMQALRGEVEALKKQNRSLLDRLRDLEKRLDAVTAKKPKTGERGN